MFSHSNSSSTDSVSIRHARKKIKRLMAWGTLCVVTFAVVAASGTARAGTLFFDDFDDNDLADGTPVSWPLGSSPIVHSFDPSGGDMILSVSGSPGNPIGRGVRAVSHDANGAATYDYDDIIVRSQVRFTLLGGEEDFVGLFVGGQTDSAESSYWAGIRQDGLLASGIVVDGTITDGMSMSTDLDVLDQDVVLEFGRTGSTLSFTAWPADGSQKPAIPQLTFNSNMFSGGTVGVFLDQRRRYCLPWG